MIIKNIRLLTVEEYAKYTSFITQISHKWWLGNHSDSPYACIVTDTGTCKAEDKRSSLDVRPVLIVEKLTLFPCEFAIPGDNIELFDFSWTVLDCDWDSATILCDSSIGTCRFNSSAEYWTDSEIEAYLNNWLSEKLADSEIVVTYKNKTEFMLLQSLCKKYNLNELCSDLFANINYLVYSPYQPWKIAREKPIRTTLSFSEFCDYITNNLLKY